MYQPDALNKSHPIYRSSPASEGENHQHHQRHADEPNEESDFSISNIQITPAAFMSMCPALLVQIEQGSCTEQYDMPAPKKDVKEITAFGKTRRSHHFELAQRCDAFFLNNFFSVDCGSCIDYYNFTVWIGRNCYGSTN